MGRIDVGRKVRRTEGEKDRERDRERERKKKPKLSYAEDTHT